MLLALCKQIINHAEAGLRIWPAHLRERSGPGTGASRKCQLHVHLDAGFWIKHEQEVLTGASALVRASEPIAINGTSGPHAVLSLGGWRDLVGAQGSPQQSPCS